MKLYLQKIILAVLVAVNMLVSSGMYAVSEKNVNKLCAAGIAGVALVVGAKSASSAYEYCNGPKGLLHWIHEMRPDENRNNRKMYFSEISKNGAGFLTASTLACAGLYVAVRCGKYVKDNWNKKSEAQA